MILTLICKWKCRVGFRSDCSWAGMQKNHVFTSEGSTPIAPHQWPMPSSRAMIIWHSHASPPPRQSNEKTPRPLVPQPHRSPIFLPWYYRGDAWLIFAINDNGLFQIVALCVLITSQNKNWWVCWRWCGVVLLWEIIVACLLLAAQERWHFGTLFLANKNRHWRRGY